jgi:GDPmannose 4,6-dehydratase
LLIGDPSKAKKELKWELKYDLDSLIDDMVSSDLQLFKRDDYLKEGGHKIFQYHE